MNKYIFFIDFDGTITKQDTLDYIITQLYSYEKYKELEGNLLNNTLSFEDYLNNTFNNITYDLNNFNESFIDDYFKDFYNLYKNDITIISSGFKTIIKYLLPYVISNVIYANDIIINENKWNVQLYNNNISINKNEIIKLIKDKYKNKEYITVFIGDGLSDFKVMNNVNILFAKRNSLLHEKCISENYNCILYDNFNDIINYFDKNK